MEIYRVRHVGYAIENEAGEVIGSHTLKTVATGEAKALAKDHAAGVRVDAEVHVLKDSGGIEKKYFYPGADEELPGTSEPKTGETTDDDLDAAREAASDPLS